MLRTSPAVGRNPADTASHSAGQARDEVELQAYYSYLEAVGLGLGELSPLAGEDVSQISLCLSQAALALGLEARIWIDDGKVYFFVRRGLASGW